MSISQTFRVYLNDIQGTTPRGAYGLYLHDAQFLALKGHVFKDYPCDRYGQNLPPKTTFVGAGPVGIEAEGA